MRKYNTNQGYTLIEMVFYTGIFSVLILAIISSFVTITRVFRQSSIQTDLFESFSVLVRMSGEIRQAYDIASLNPTSLTLNTQDEAGANITISFALSGESVTLSKNGSPVGNLNSPNLQITDLSFSQITTAENKAVKISLTTKSAKDASRTENFYNTVVLRGGYQE